MVSLKKLTTPTAQLLGSALVIVLIIVLGASVLALLGNPYDRARERAALEARRHWVARVLPVAVEGLSADDFAEVVNESLFGTRKALTHFAGLTSSPAGANAIKWTIPDGYNGDIVMAMSVDKSGRILRLEVLAHRETPGFGAVISDPDSTWLAEFSGKSLPTHGLEAWRLRSDGGELDGVSGATITSNAIVEGVQTGLRYLMNIPAGPQ